MPANVNNLQHDLFAKFRIANTRVEWKKELAKCKYIPGTSTLTIINKFQLYCAKLQWPLPVQIEKFVCILPMQLRQFIVSRAHATFAEVTESFKTFQELIEVDTVLHVFKYITFKDVGCTLCNESHKSLDCPSLCSIIEMEVSSSASHNDSSSISDSRSPNYDFSSRRRRYKHRSRSTSRLPRYFDRGHSPEIDYSWCRDYRYRSPDRNNNYWDRQYNPSYYDRRYNNSNGFSPVRSYSQGRYPNQYQNRPFPVRYQGGNRRNSPNNYNNNGYGWNRGPNMVERVSSAINSSLIATIKLDKLIAIIRHHSMGMIGIWIIQTITLLLPSLMCQALWHVMVLPLMLDENRVFQTPAH